jgi:glucan phosphoethanolaminetransferase (alkaline phosphatase superfamily)
MIFSIDIWLLPAIAASSSSYLVCLAWERIKNSTAPDGLLEGFLASLSFLMGAICAYYRYRLYSQSLENNVIIMFAVGASTTYLWLLLRRYLPGFRGR